MAVKVSDVFVAGGMPDATYVDRSGHKLERSLEIALEEGYQIVCVTGPTKSGKTVLCRRVLERTGRASIWIDAGQVKDAAAIWANAADKLSQPTQFEEEYSEQGKSGGRAIIYGEYTISEKRTGKFEVPLVNAVLEACEKEGICFVVDDFHYLDESAQREFIRNIKSSVFNGLRVILIAVPHRAFDAISAEREMEGRFRHIGIPVWQNQELAQIADQGFPELNLSISKSDVDEFSTEAFGSPILMQRFCQKVCSAAEVFVRSDIPVSLSPSAAEKREIYSEVADQFGYPTFQALATGPQARTDRLERSIRSGDERVDIYQAILRAVAATGPKTSLPYNEIRDALRGLLVDGDMPQKHQITSTLRHMTETAKKKIQGEPVLEWRDDTLYLTDASLMFYLRWAFRKQV